MKLLYGIFLVLMVFVSACAQQPTGQTVQPLPQETPPVVEEAEPETAEVVEEETPLEKAEVRILGQGEFDPNELAISVGETVTWVNTDSKEAVIIIFKDGKVYQNSQKIKPGEKFEHEFKEQGSYQYWRNVAFSSDGAKITAK